ncbi:hypothetical protein SPAN111604_15080 [Sphingomonas antarctica]
MNMKLASAWMAGALAVMGLAGPASATVYNLSLTGSIANETSGSFNAAGGATLGYGTLILDGFTPFSIASGDGVNIDLALDGPFTVPLSVASPGYGQFFGVNLFGANNSGPTGASNTGSVLFNGLMPANLPNPRDGGCGNCISLLLFQPVGPEFSFTGLQSSTNVDGVFAPFDLTGASISYQVTLGAAVPEPAPWALMIGGFGVVGGAMRRRPRAKVLFA